MIWLAAILLILAGLSFEASRRAMSGAYNAASALGAGATLLRYIALLLAVGSVVFLILGLVG